jgi:putative membrane protein
MTTLIALALLAGAAHAEDKNLSDPQIATIVLTAHQIDIDRGKTARHSKNIEVTQFADQMIEDHTAGKNEALALATKLGVKPEASEVTKSLKADAKKTAARLNKEKSATFDKDYIETEVAYHQAVIDTIKNVLIPEARSAQLKTLLEQAVPTLEGHLQHAKNVQAQLGVKSAAK